MTRSEQVVQNLYDLTTSGELLWHNFKDEKPKYSLSVGEYEKVRTLVKYPKRVIHDLMDGYNKYQSYYAFYDGLTLVLTKGKRDDRLLLAAGTVEEAPGAPAIGDKPRKRRYFNVDAAVFENKDGDLTAFHQAVHQASPGLKNESGDALDMIANRLSD